MAIENKQEINNSILRLFKDYLYNETTNEMINKTEGLKYGIYLEEDLNKELFEEVVKQYGKDGYLLNQTFHKSLEKVATTDNTTLIIEQLIHYFTTYGIEELTGESHPEFIYIPKEKLEIPELEEDVKLIPIKKITEIELEKRLTDLLTSGIALSKKSVHDIISLSDFVKLDIEEIKNKEVKIAFYDKYNKVPADPTEFMRYFLYKLTDSTLLIKDKKTKDLLNFINTDIELNFLKLYKEQHGLEKLSEVFNRFKPLFIAMKKRPISEERWFWRYADEREKEDKARKELNNIINQISKLSKIHHKPLVLNDKLSNVEQWLSSISNSSTRTDVVYDELSNYSIWRIIRALNYMSYESGHYKQEKAYKIRNGKVFVKQDDKKSFKQTWAIPIFREYIVNKLKENVEGKSIYIPNNINYMIPQSEKQFVGNVPFNSVIDIPKGKALLLGIHWLNVINKQGEENRVDLDIKLSSNKYTVSWNTRYKDDNDDIIYTGDQTSAPIETGGASEYIYISDEVKDTIMSFSVNHYTMGVGDAPFEFIIAYAPPKAEILEKGRDFVVNPNDIIAKIPCIAERNQSEHNLGVLFTGEYQDGFIMTDVSMKNVPVSKDNILDEILRNYMLNYKKYTACNKLECLLEEAGAKISNEPFIEKQVEYALVNINEEQKLVSLEELSNLEEPIVIDNGIFKLEKVPVDLDLSLENLNKDTLIKLFM